MACTRRRGSDSDPSGNSFTDEESSLREPTAEVISCEIEAGTGSAVRFECFFRILRVASVFAWWN